MDYSRWLTDEEQRRAENLTSQDEPLSADDVRWILEKVDVDHKYPESWEITCPDLVKKLCRDLLAAKEKS